jgi:hypothetical protein
MIGVLYNCQGDGLTAALKAMLPDRDVICMHGGAYRDDAKARAEAHETLLKCDDVIALPMGPEMRQLATARLRRTVKRLHMLPPVGFRGFHPDQIYIHKSDGRLVQGITGDYQSRIAAVGFLAGLSPEDTAGLYNAVVFSRLGYMRAYTEDFELLSERYLRLDIDATAMLERMRTSGCFMHSCNHPKAWVLQELARIACGMMGAPRDLPLPQGMEDFLAHHPIHPLFEEIASRIGIPAEGAFRPGHGPAQQPHAITTLDFVRDSFGWFAKVPPETLRRADGVLQALATLNLDCASHTAKTRRRTEPVALLSTQGTIVRIDAGTAMSSSPDAQLLHMPLAIDTPHAPPLQFDINVDALPAESPLLGGVTVLPAPLPGMVSLRRNGRFLGADAGHPHARFLRDAAGDAESFRIVPGPAMAMLKDLVSQSWVREDDPAAGPLPPPRLEAGPALYFGEARVDLRTKWPQPLAPDRTGAARATLELDGVPVTLRAMPQPQAVMAAPVAATVALGRRLVVTGGRAWLPPPLTVSNADRLWVHETCGDPDGLPWVIEAPAITIRREFGRMAGGTPWIDGEPAAADASYDGPAVAEASVMVDSPPDQRADGAPGASWAAPLIKLLAIAPYLPDGSMVIAPTRPGVAAGLAAAWHSLGFQPFVWAPAPAPTYRADDLMWSEPEAPWVLPAESLRAVRSAVIRNAPDGVEKLFVHSAGAHRPSALQELERNLAKLGYASLDLTLEAPATILQRLRQAAWLVGAGNDVRVSAFCPANVKVIELTSAARFEQAAWRQSCALGVLHAVLPCADTESGVAVDMDKLTVLLRMARMRL